MDILNWLYMVKNKLVKTTVQDPAKDLVALATNATYAKRGDKYQTYTVPLADAVKDACVENNTLTTGVYQYWPFLIGYPVISKTCQKIKSTYTEYNYPESYDTWRITGTVLIAGETYTDVIYLGTLYSSSIWGPLPASIKGTIRSFDDNTFYTNYCTPLGYTAPLFDYDSYTFKDTKINFVQDGFGSNFDLYLTYSTESTSAKLDGEVYFEYEILIESGIEVTFVYND